MDEAIASYRDVIRLDPNHFKAHYNLANLYSYEKANSVQALFHYRRFVSLAPSHPLAPRAQVRLSELTGAGIPEDIRTQGKGISSKEGSGETHLTGEIVTPPIVTPSPPVEITSSIAEEQRPQATMLDPTRSFPHVVCIEGQATRDQIEGSGFMVSPGYILVSGHQVKQSHRLTVQLQNGERYPASVISVSDVLDLALLQIPFSQTEALLFVPTDDSPTPGEPVMAVGCPFGLNHSVAQGIISAPERILGGHPVLQTDVAINPGNSGGPLLNKQGKVVGVVLGMLDGARGIAFVLPSREAKRFIGETFYQMGTLLAEAKRYPEASSLLAESIRFWPLAKAYNNMGEAFRRMKNGEKAEQSYIKALEMDPKYADAHFNIGTFYDSMLRNPEKAAYHYRKYLELKPRSPEATPVLKWLKEIEEKK